MCGEDPFSQIWSHFVHLYSQESCSCKKFFNSATICTCVLICKAVKVALIIIFSHTVHPDIVEHPVITQSVYPGEMVNFSCRAEGFSTLSYSWFMMEYGSAIGVEIESATDPMYTISNPIYDHNNIGYYCVATNNEGIAASNTSILTGIVSFIFLTDSVLQGTHTIKYLFLIQFSDLTSLISPSLHN